MILSIVTLMSVAACDSTDTKSTTESSKTSETTAEVTETMEATTTAPLETTEETVETSIDASDPYSEFLEDYKKAVQDPQDTWYYGPGVEYDVLPPDGTVGLITQGLSETMSYTLYDLDGDGVEELLIGGVWQDEYVDLIGVVTMDGDDYKIVFAGWERRSVIYLGEGYFYAAGSSSAFAHVSGLYEYNGNDKCMDLICMLYSENEEQDDEVYEYYEGVGGEDMSDVIYTGNEALETFEKKYEELQGLNNELLDAEWVEFSFKE